MSSGVFPSLIGDVRPDSSQYEVTTKDKALTLETEGGYKYSRARHTRPNTEVWKVAYTDISNANMITIRNFYKLMGGGSLSFDWTNPETGVTHEVRFLGDLTCLYRGVGDTKLWGCSFELEEL